jgi:Tfp pilus assembly protein PilO
VQVKTKNVMVSALVVLLVGALWYKVVYSPMESKASKAKSAAHEADSTAQTLQHQIGALQAAQKQAKLHDPAASVMLQAVPATAAEASFLRAIDALRIGSGANWQSITPSPPALSAGVASIAVTITVQGTETQLLRYASGLYDMKRIFLVDNLNITPGGNGTGIAALHAVPGFVFPPGELQLQVTGRIFSGPGAVPVPAGTTGTPAAATTPATGAPAPTQSN